MRSRSENHSSPRLTTCQPLLLELRQKRLERGGCGRLAGAHKVAGARRAGGTGGRGGAIGGGAGVGFDGGGSVWADAGEVVASRATAVAGSTGSTGSWVAAMASAWRGVDSPREARASAINARGGEGEGKEHDLERHLRPDRNSDRGEHQRPAASVQRR